jgi:putative MATE family efflux protein
MIVSHLKQRKETLFIVVGLALPAIGEMALNTMLGVADTVMISHFVGKEALAAVGFANQVIFSLIYIFSSFNTGAIALVSRRLGENDYPRLKKTAEQNVSLNLLIALTILGLSLMFRGPLFHIFDITPEIYQAIQTYFGIILVGLVPMFLNFAFAALLRGSGNTITPMVITGIANVINILGNFLLIKGIGPFPEMGIAGAAWATSASRLLTMFLYIYVLYIKKSRIRLKPRFFLDKKIIAPLVKISLPGGVEQCLIQSSYIVMSIIISQLETVAEAAFRVLAQIESLSFMPAIGLAMATSTLMGKSLGEKNENKALEVGYLAIGLSLFWAVIIGMVFILFPRFILSLFSRDGELILTALPAMVFIGINQLGLNSYIILAGALRGAGDTKSVMINSTIRLWTTFVPLTYLFVHTLNMGLKGIWIGEIISFTFYGLFLFLRFRSRKWARVII